MSSNKKTKKQKFHGVSLNVLFITGLGIIFLLSVISLAIIASNGIESLSKFAAQVSEKSIRTGASFLFLEKTKKKAEKYSCIFDEASDMTSLLAVQLSTAWNNFQYYKFPDNFQLEYTRDKEQQSNEPILGVLKNELSFLYWGDSEELPLLQQKKIFYFSHYFKLIEYIKNNSRYYLSCWMSFRNEKYLISYSDTQAKLYSVLPGKKTLDNFFQPKTISKVDDWTDVYRDITGKLIVSTFKNIIDYNGRKVGLAGLDVDIDSLLKDILKIGSSDVKEFDNNSFLNTAPAPFSFVINRENSKLIAFPDKYYASFGLPSQNFKDYDYRQELKIKLEESKFPKIREIAKMMQKQNEGISTIKLKDEEYLIAFSKIVGNNWVFSAVYPVKQLFSSIAETRNEMNRQGRQLTIKFILIAVFFLLLSVFIVTRFFNRYVLDPIYILKEGVDKLGKENFDSKLVETGVLDVKGLTRSFNKMKDELKNYMKKLEGEIVERKSLETEIEVAKKIQRSILPRTTAIFQRDEFDLYGELFSAKVIAGDCYDFFYLKKNKIALLIADVFGEGGISAAFYMTVLKSAIRDICLQESGDPAKALAHANRFLCGEYKVGMYVSLFLIYYDLDTGAIQYGMPVIILRCK